MAHLLRCKHGERRTHPLSQSLFRAHLTQALIVLSALAGDIAEARPRHEIGRLVGVHAIRRCRRERRGAARRDTDAEFRLAV